MSTIDQITALIGELSFAEKLSINEQLASSIRKEGGGKVGKKVKADKAEKADKADKPKRKAALGTLAWTAFVKHMKTTRPDDFEGISKESEKLVIVKGMKAEDPAAYDAFIAKYKEDHKDDASEASASEVESVAEEVPAPVPVKKVTKVVPKVPTVVATAAATAAAKKAAKTVEPAKKVVKTVVKTVKKKEEAPPMPQIEIDGTNYWHDPASNGLWEVTGETVVDGTGSWIGYYQPGNEEEPIRFTEAFGDE
jgi:hypothetical protein